MAGRSAKPPEVPSDLMGQDSVVFGEYSSPPCFMHELDPSFTDLPFEIKRPSSLLAEPDQNWDAVRKWRKESRANLLKLRMQIAARDRVEWSENIRQRLEAALASHRDKLIGFYWPFRGEYDARPVLTRLRSQGWRLALPVVVEKAQPLQFREWWPGVPMTRGVWNIPIPASGEPVLPDILIAPLVGFDSQNYRLGYGGGFYDRTIAARSAKPLVIGVGFELTRLETIHPQAHDIPMDCIITEAEAQTALAIPSIRINRTTP